MKNHEEGDVEIDCADIGFDPDCTGDDVGSDIVYVTKKRVRLRNDVTPKSWTLN